MKWIEQIRVRSSTATITEAMLPLLKQVKEIEESATGAETFLMQHALYEGDLTVVVVWQNNIQPQKTREGLMVSEQLQKLGSIDHAVWIPTEKDGEQNHMKKFACA